MKQQRKMFLARSAMTLLLAMLTTMTAFAETVSTYYIDADGTQHDVTATVLTSELLENRIGTENQTTWYVVNSSFTTNCRILFDGDLRLILADGKTLTINSGNDSSVSSVHSHLTIYGQTLGTGTLNVNNTSANTFDCSFADITICGGTVNGSNTSVYSVFEVNNLTISGGTVKASASTVNTARAIHALGTLTISGGTVNATGTYPYGSVSAKTINISGGKTTVSGASGLYADNSGLITLGLTSDDDFIKCKKYQGTVMIAGGQTLRDEDGNAYTGTLTSDQIAAIADKTLTLSGVSSEQDIVVSYIDANDEEQTVMALPLNGDETALAPGWYVVQNTNPDGVDLAYTHKLICFDGDVNIILCDGAEMTVTSEELENAIEFKDDYTLTIYGQSLGTGRLSLTGYYNGILATSANIIINGGDVTVTGNDDVAISCGTFTMNGGSLNATSNGKGDYDNGINVGTSFTFNGGNFSATSANAAAIEGPWIPVTLSWTRPSDSFYASSFGSVNISIAEGKPFIDEDGTIHTSEDVGYIYGKTLRPFNGCYSPKNLTATAVTTSSATLTWEAGNDETQWQVSWSTDGGSTWTTPVTVNSTQFEMTNLDPGTTFQVQVLSVYGEGQFSNPSSITFTTHSASDAPVELSSNATVNTATLSWTGFQENYNVRYAVSLENVEDFEDGTTFADWTTISNNEANSSVDNGYGIYDNCFRFSSYNSAEDYNQYLISPELNGMLSMEFKYRTSGNGETFKVGYSTTGNDVADFTFGNEIATSSAEWVMYSCTLPAGTKYVAINYFSEFQYYLYVDDITFKSAGSWENVNNTTSPLAITGLTPQTSYLWQVQGILDNDVTEWSTGTFTTLEGASITFAKEGYGTYYNSERDVVLPAGMKARIVTENKGEGKLAYETVANGDTEENTVPAGTAVMLQVAPAEATQTGTIGLATPEAEAISQTNLLHGSDESTMTTGGEKYYKQTYNLEGADKVIGWYWGAADGAAFTIGAHKAWLALSTEQAARPMLSLPAFDDVTTDIVPTTNCTNHTNSTDDWYTIDGRKLNGKPTTKGIYLNGGRKIVVK